MSVFGENIKTLRKSRSLTQKQLQDVTGVGRSSIAGYETTDTEPNIKHVQKICQYFGITVEEILGSIISMPENHKKSKSPEPEYAKSIDLTDDKVAVLKYPRDKITKKDIEIIKLELEQMELRLKVGIDKAISHSTEEDLKKKERQN